MVTFYDFPKEHWGHLRTTNPVESPFAALRLRTDAAKRYKRVDRAIAVIWKMLMVAEQRFRRLKAPELIEDVYLGAQYADGIAIESTAERSPPDVVYTPIDVTSPPEVPTDSWKALTADFMSSMAPGSPRLRVSAISRLLPFTDVRY